MTLIDSVSDDAADLYADILEDVAHLLAKQDVEAARALLVPIAGEQWAVRAPTTPTATVGTRTADVRRVSARSHAEALIRDRVPVLPLWRSWCAAVHARRDQRCVPRGGPV